MIDKKTIAQRTGKKVLLFSSGLDSYIINQLEKPDVLLFIDNKSNYSALEMKYLKSLNYENLIFIEDFINHSSIELENMIIPARNLYFAMIAANFGEEIILGATAGDRSTDKDKMFGFLTSQLLSHIYLPSHWCSKDKVHVNLKYKDWTKQDLVRAFVCRNFAQGISTIDSVNLLLNDSFSCYHPTEQGGQCNRCKPDLRKFLAILGATGISVDYHYEIGNKPSEYFTSEVVEEWLEELKNDKSRGRESEETIEALKLI